MPTSPIPYLALKTGVTMLAKDVMTVDPICVAPETEIAEAARTMMERDCGALPVVSPAQKLIGIVTDRDLVCRALSAADDASRTVDATMTSPVVTISAETTLEQCYESMAVQQVRRLVVVDAEERVLGIIALADLARVTQPEILGTLVQRLTVASVTGLA
jgi:CBS domain-containing protein